MIHECTGWFRFLAVISSRARMEMGKKFAKAKTMPGHKLVKKTGLEFREGLAKNARP
jgi:hypothetical protein